MIKLPRLFAMILILAIATMTCAAQESAVTTGPITTLRISANIIQIPLLVLTKDKESLPSPIAASRFEVRLDDQWIHPQRVRLEGQDPISLTVLIDARQLDSSLLPKLSQALASLASSSLSSRDDISLFLMHCSGVRAVQHLPVDANKLRAALDNALQLNNPQDAGADCAIRSHLWDTLAYATRNLEGVPGRRTILAITSGEDHDSRIAPLDLITLAQSDGVTIFGLDPTSAVKPFSVPHEETLSSIAESSGGLKLELKGGNIVRALKSFVKMLRERYIVDLQLPSAKPGTIQTAARISGTLPGYYFIRIAGKSVPLPAPDANDGTKPPVPDN